MNTKPTPITNTVRGSKPNGFFRSIFRFIVFELPSISRFALLGSRLFLDRSAKSLFSGAAAPREGGISLIPARRLLPGGRTREPDRAQIPLRSDLRASGK